MQLHVDRSVKISNGDHTPGGLPQFPRTAFSWTCLIVTMLVATVSHLDGYDYQFLVRDVFAAKLLSEMNPRQPKAPQIADREACPCSL